MYSRKRHFRDLKSINSCSIVNYFILKNNNNYNKLPDTVTFSSSNYPRHCYVNIISVTQPAGFFSFKGNIEYYSDEVEINAKFRTFTKNCSFVFAGHNTVSAQLKVNSKRGKLFRTFLNACNLEQNDQTIYNSYSDLT